MLIHFLLSIQRSGAEISTCTHCQYASARGGGRDSFDKERAEKEYTSQLVVAVVSCLNGISDDYEYHQVYLWCFLTKWEGYGTSEGTWELVRAFVHDNGKLNHVFVDYCLAHAPRFDTALRQARRISSTLKRKATAEEPNKDTAADNKEPGEVSSKKVSQQRGGKRRRTEECTVGGMAEDWLP